jgi:hypothetical protein
MPSSSLSSGDLTQIASTPNEMEAEMIRALLSEHGIPSVVKHTAGGTAYGPFFPHLIFVPEELAERAREVLEGTPGGELAG